MDVIEQLPVPPLQPQFILTSPGFEMRTGMSAIAFSPSPGVDSGSTPLLCRTGAFWSTEGATVMAFVPLVLSPPQNFVVPLIVAPFSSVPVHGLLLYIPHGTPAVLLIPSRIVPKPVAGV